MFIIVFMAGVTVQWGLVVFRCYMTFFALGGCMHTNKRKACQVVIKEHIILPALFVMATVTLFSLLALMDVICLVAAYAFCARFILVQITFMALYTAKFFVFAT